MPLVEHSPLQAIADHAPVMLWMTNTGGEPVYFNEWWYTFTGRPELEPLADSWLRALHPDDVETAASAFEAGVATRAAFQQQYRLRRRDGSYRWVLDLASPRFDPAGNFAGYVGSLVDITEQKHLVARTAQLQAATAAFARATTSCDVAKVVVSAMRDVLCAGGYIVYIADEERGCLVRRGAHGHITPEPPPMYLPLDAELPCSRTCRTGEPVWLESRAELLATFPLLAEIPGSEKFQAIVSLPLRATRLRGTLSFAFDRPTTFDHTDREFLRQFATQCSLAFDRAVLAEAEAEAVREREQMIEQLRANLRDNELFAGILAHDLRTPLGAVDMAVDLALAHVPPETIARPLRRIATAAERMDRMIEQLLDFTRTRMGGGIAIEPAIVDLGELCRRVIGELELARPEAKLSLEVIGQPVGSWDPDRMLQVIANLAGNAIVHGVGQRARLRIDARDDHEVRVDVANDGVIAPNVLPVLFEPFRSARGHKKQGLGLGMFITKQIVTAHGGTVNVTSSAEAGTCCMVALPRHAR